MQILPQSSKNWNQDLDFISESPFQEKEGLLEFKPEYTTPEFFARWSFITNLYGERVLVDHCVLSFPDLPALEKYAKALEPYRIQMVEGPGLFPMEFCPETYTIKPDLWMHLLTILMPSQGLLVLGAPHSPRDQFDRFLHGRGQSAVHHVAIQVDDMHTAVLHWQKHGFHPLSKQPLDGDSLCQWFLKNSAGQIIELIHRRPNNHATFYCQNIGGLRLSEVSSTNLSC